MPRTTRVWTIASSMTAEDLQSVRAARVRRSLADLPRLEGVTWRLLRVLTLVATGRLTPTEALGALDEVHAERIATPAALATVLLGWAERPVCVKPTPWARYPAQPSAALREARAMHGAVERECQRLTAALWWRLRVAAGHATVEQAMEGLGVDPVGWVAFNLREEGLAADLPAWTVLAEYHPPPGGVVAAQWMAPNASGTSLDAACALVAACAAALAAVREARSHRPRRAGGVSIGGSVQATL